MDEIAKAIVVTGIIVPISTVINILLGMIVLVVCFYVCKSVATRYIARSKLTDEELGARDLAKLHEKQPKEQT